MSREVRASIEVEAPLSRVFDYWRTLENLPNFMSNLEEVRSVGNRRTHWRVKGPLGAGVEFDVENREEENEAVAWASVGGNVETSGKARFRELGPGKTLVEVTIDYGDSTGGLGEAEPRLVADPQVVVDRDLRNFKDLVEGRATAEEIRRRASNGSARTSIPRAEGSDGIAEEEADELALALVRRARAEAPPREDVRPAPTPEEARARFAERRAGREPS